MKKKRIFYSEAAYILGLIFLAMATALIEAADFGVSMVVAPAYLLHLKLSEFLPFFTFGVSEFTLQVVIIALIAIILKKLKFSYLFSFVTIAIYSVLLDLSMAALEFLPTEHIAARISIFTIGVIVCSASVSMLFHTYISPEAYELFVKEVSANFGLNINKFKTCYDCTSCAIGIIMSFAFFGFGHFEGIKFGTVICALLNGFLISRFSKIYEKIFEFKDKFNFRKYFE